MEGAVKKLKNQFFMKIRRIILKAPKLRKLAQTDRHFTRTNSSSFYLKITKKVKRYQ